MHRKDKLILIGAGIGVALAVGLFMFGGPPKSPGTIQRPRPAATPAPGASATETARAAAAERAAAREKVATNRMKVAGKALNAELAESRPEPGTDLELNQGQITFCLAEAIRLEGGREFVSGAEAEKNFDAMVKDFNSRCAKYRYRQTAYNNAKTRVDNMRAALKREGAARFQR